MTYDDSWDRPHTPVDTALWQESDCYWFYDEAAGIGGFHRIGQKPAQGTGQATLFVFKRGAERFVLSDGDATEFDIRSGDRREHGQSVGGHVVESLGGGRMRYGAETPDCSLDLEFHESFYEPRDWSMSGHSDEFMQSINSQGHLECSGRIRGTVRIGQETHDVSALAHRDRSWGIRDHARVSLHRYRMFSGTVGPELSFASFLLDVKDGPAMCAGFVVRNGVQEDVRKLRVITTTDHDGLTPLAARAILTLERGDEIEVNATPVQGFLTPLRDIGCATQDHISTITHSGLRGFADLEFCNNPGRGTYIPTQDDVTFLAVDQGLSRSVDYDL
ncbi:DUF7064 domain-containing protein [Hyphomonas johnsonii]|uniref:Uncharacterized protein n=1 Tax=Hyphomonas johnsonii MHS-2 TaxID=1280950 RepID=A0A059FNP8_9PROT|nr:hypothetical protein [Hyphomonas johnsonii]KCZ92146.1 hypothetical protein HJO_08929 [Hyphomonas johnsonii MHS-2]